MIHELTIGHLDSSGIHDRMAVSSRPLEAATVNLVLAEFPGLDGYLVAPRHGKADAERGEAFAARLQSDTGCLVAERRNGRIIALGWTATGRAIA